MMRDHSPKFSHSRVSVALKEEASVVILRFVFKPRSEGNRDHLFLFNESPFKFVQTESILPNYKTLISNHKPSMHTPQNGSGKYHWCC